jgi:chaperonin GroEL
MTETAFGTELKSKLLSGVKKLNDSVSSTLGPAGRTVLIKGDYGQLTVTKDGVSVAKEFKELEDPIESIGAELVKKVSIKSANEVGDGTTTSTLLSYAILEEGLKHVSAGQNPIEIKKGIDAAVEELKTALNNLTADISDNQQIKEVATISGNNDVEIGNLIAMALEKVGRDGVVAIEESKSGETSLEIVEGMQFDRGYKSPYFVTDNNSMSTTINDPFILIADKKFTTVKELLPILEAVSNQNKPLVIIAEDIDGEALATLIVNKARGILKVVAVKAPDFGDRRKLLLEDIAIMTGGQVFSAEKGMKLDKFSWDWFGQARVVTVGKEQTTIVDGKGESEKITARIEELQTQIEKAQSPYEREKLQERLAKFIGGVAIVHVGGFTESEMKEKKDRVDDALQATKAALEEGIVPGGGMALLHARNGISDLNSIGGRIVYNACAEPFKKILSNAGYELEDIYNALSGATGGDYWWGFNLMEEDFDDMRELGIIDPAKVTRTALENAASVAGTILLTEAVVVDKPEENKNDDGLGGMMGMM